MSEYTQAKVQKIVSTGLRRGKKMAQVITEGATKHLRVTHESTWGTYFEDADGRVYLFDR